MTRYALQTEVRQCVSGKRTDTIASPLFPHLSKRLAKKLYEQYVIRRDVQLRPDAPVFEGVNTTCSMYGDGIELNEVYLERCPVGLCCVCVCVCGGGV